MAKRALGRGLSAFFTQTEENKPEEAPIKEASLQNSGQGSDTLAPQETVPHPSLDTSLGAQVDILPISSVYANPLQPRHRFAEDKLLELADSIRLHGIIQPVVVTKTAEGYRLVIGERRYRASKIAGLETIPAIVRNFAEREVLEVALIENLHREDLNPIEEAQAFAFLLTEHGLTHEQLSERIGFSRSAVTNTLRLLSLDDEIRSDLASGLLSPGHGRAVLPIKNEKQRLSIWRRIREEGLSVRQTEKLVASLMEGSKKEKAKPVSSPLLSADWQELVKNLSQQLGTDIRLKPRNDDKGRVEFHYSDREQLDKLMELLVYFGEQASANSSTPVGSTLSDADFQEPTDE